MSTACHTIWQRTKAPAKPTHPELNYIVAPSDTIWLGTTSNHWRTYWISKCISIKVMFDVNTKQSRPNIHKFPLLSVKYAWRVQFFFGGTGGDSTIVPYLSIVVLLSISRVIYITRTRISERGHLIGPRWWLAIRQTLMHMRVATMKRNNMKKKAMDLKNYLQRCFVCACSSHWYCCPCCCWYSPSLPCPPWTCARSSSYCFVFFSSTAEALSQEKILYTA